LGQSASSPRLYLLLYFFGERGLMNIVVYVKAALDPKRWDSIRLDPKRRP